MIEKSVQTPKGKLSIRMPENLDEITLEQMIALQAAENLGDVEAISILSGVPADELKQVTNATELSIFNEQILKLAFAIKNLYNSDNIPQKVTFNINGNIKQVKVSNNLAIEPAGAYWAARDIIADEIAAHVKAFGEADWQANFSPALQACGKLLAQYFYCRATGKPYNEYEAAAFIDVINTMKVTEALPIAKHFFTCYPDLSRKKIGFWQQFRHLWRNVREYRRLKSLSTLTP
ncbi:hypothetical protein LJ707_12640 [Mucilaginibacter sp. UR6-1]|uniref:hypothetical protein n=1 Tax=Mucilaginibacter sp. UR6-1 TaxID=1435643 RepID=UPI001E59A9CF|nr:hypothetical protein [Mucilaginibacter sp. UR6-1]MCC8409779.1 hypothetical protein [Mucilaginibacter sp. UR6-1]